eukprot:scaffold45324_cov66-Phaeocystis_antarctica.AAC.3
MIAVPEGPVPPLMAARMAARYAALEAKGNQGAIGRMDNARRIFQREEFRCLKGGQLTELDALRRSQFVHNPSRRAVGGGSAYASGWGFYCPDGAGHAFVRPMLTTPDLTPLVTPERTPPATPERTPRPAERRAHAAAAAAAWAAQHGPAPRHGERTLTSAQSAHTLRRDTPPLTLPPRTADAAALGSRQPRSLGGGGGSGGGGSGNSGLPRQPPSTPPPPASAPHPRVQPRTGAAAAPFATSHNQAASGGGWPGSGVGRSAAATPPLPERAHRLAAAAPPILPERAQRRVGAAAAPFATDMNRPPPPPAHCNSAAILQQAAATPVTHCNSAAVVRQVVARLTLALTLTLTLTLTRPLTLPLTPSPNP